MPSDQAVRRLGHILLATDFAPGAEAATRWAEALATAHDARVTVVHATDRNGAAASERDASTSASETAARFARAETRLEPGRPHEVITSVAAEIRVDLIVMGRHTGVRHLLGGTAERVVRSAAPPVLTVPPGECSSPPRIDRILVGTDFSPSAARAMDVAVWLLPPADSLARVVLLHVWCPPVAGDIDCALPVLTAPLAFSEDSVRGELEAAAAPWRAAGVEVETLPREGYPATTIADEARAVDADLVALGTHGRRGLAHLVLGSIAERVLRHATCPVITVRETCARDDGEDGSGDGPAGQPAGQAGGQAGDQPHDAE